MRRLILLLVCCISVAHVAAGQTAVTFQESHNVVVLSVPDQPAALQVDLLHLKVDSNTLRKDATGRRLQATDSQGWELTSFLYPLDHSMDSKSLREEMWTDMRKGTAKDGLTLTQVKTYEHGPIAMLEYMVENFQGHKVDQMSVFGYIVSGNLGMDFHISKTGFTSADRSFMEALINGIKPIENYQPDSKLLFEYGSVFYLQQNWARAAQNYQKALELEKTKKQLPPNDWTVLVDNLGLAYAMSGSLEKARSTFEFGVKEDPAYPMFHYNLACADAEAGNLQGALEELKTAFHYKSNSLPGEGVPDPAKDESFKSYLGDASFQRLTRELCPTSARTEGGWTCN